MKRLSILLALLGLLATTGLVAWFGAGHVAHAVLSVGWPGFAALLGWQALLFGVLGAAWTAIAGAAGRTPPGTYVWGRMVRDAATTCLPFSPIGGFVAGASAVGLLGVRRAVAAAATIVDVTAEVLAQLVFAGIALCILISKQPDTTLAVPVAVAVGVGVAAMAGFVIAQRGAASVFGALGRRIAGHWFDAARSGVDAVQGVLVLIYTRPARLALAVMLHLLGWLATGIGDWIAFRLLGADIELSAAIAIAGLLNAVLAIAFVVPGYAGVQEAAYAAFGTLFGLPAEIGIAASLLRRARDIVLGVPILLAWQALAARRFRAVRVPVSADRD